MTLQNLKKRKKASVPFALWQYSGATSKTFGNNLVETELITASGIRRTRFSYAVRNAIATVVGRSSKNSFGCLSRTNWKDQQVCTNKSSRRSFQKLIDDRLNVCCNCWLNSVNRNSTSYICCTFSCIFF